MDPDQTAPIGTVSSGSTLFATEAFKHFSRREKQTTFVAIGALRVKSECGDANVVSMGSAFTKNNYLLI